jgi:hypothetical protein
MFDFEYQPEIPQILDLELNILSKKRKQDNELLDEDYIINSFNSSFKNKREDYNYDCHIEVFMLKERKVNLSLEKEEDILNYLEI